MGSGQQHLPWIHVKDLANLFVFAATNDNVKGVLNGVAPQVGILLWRVIILYILL